MTENISNLEEKIYEETNIEDSRLFSKSSDFYFKPKFFEKWGNGRIYEFACVKPLKSLYTKIGKKIVKKATGSYDIDRENNYFIWDSSEEGLKKFDYQTRKNEAIHLIPSFIFSGFTLINLLVGNYIVAGIDTISNLAVGIGPVLVQRYNRTRLHKVINKIEEKEKKNTGL